MKVIFHNKEQESTIKLIKEENCYHEYLKTNKQTKDKVCISCGRVIYLNSKQM